MYKRVSIALQNPKVSITLRLATLTLLGSLAWFKFKGLEFASSWNQVSWLFPLLVAFALSVLNLSTETAKYQSLFGKGRIGFSTAFRSVLAGMSVGIWTPNRVGEFVGRLRYAPDGEKKRSMGATVVGSFLQGGVTILFGCVGLILFDFNIEMPVDLNLVLALGLIFALALVLVFRKGPIARLRKKHYEVNGSELLLAFGWATLRYAIFSTQFVILQFAFGFSGTLLEAFSGVFLLYVIQSYIPGSFLSELGVREVLSVLFFASFFENPIGAPLAAFCLWGLNIGLPILSWSLYSGVKKLEA
ncbi:MAG: lysylphosphatidylglycerol synthase domain-containing protein [Cryomorphaceae bacterium]